MSEFPEAATLRRARLLWDAQRANLPLGIGKRPFRCIGGPLHGATVRLDVGQSEYRAVTPDAAEQRSYYGAHATDLPAPRLNHTVYRMAKFGSGTHQMAITVMLAEGVPEGDEALPLLLDAFMPEMLTAYEVGEDG